MSKDSPTKKKESPKKKDSPKKKESPKKSPKKTDEEAYPMEDVS